MRTTSSSLAFLFLVGFCAAGCSKPQPENSVAVENEPAPDITTPNPHAPRIRFEEPIPGDPNGSVEVVNLDDDNLAKLATVEWKEADWKALFAVYIDPGKGVNRAEQSPEAGRYLVEEFRLRFVPHSPLKLGIRYMAYFDPSRLPTRGDAQPMEKAFSLPGAEDAGPAVITEVYPTRQVLPENQLKFYIHFSRPMSRGEAYKRIRLVKIETKDNKRIETEIEGPFLEREPIDEPWDPSCKRFTLFLDPGRIKRGLKPREELGPILEEGKEYALAISSEWRDATGNPLGAAYRKSFKVMAPDDKMPDVKTWEIIAPPAATVQPIVIKFPEPMDHALLQRCIWVLDPKGRKRPGAVTVEFQEIHFEFAPEDPWEVGKYQLVVDTTLEDLAGNNLREPFEVDVFKKVEKRIKTETITIPFEVPIPGKEEQSPKR